MSDDIAELIRLTRETNRALSAKLDNVLAEMSIIRDSLTVIETTQEIGQIDRILSSLKELDHVLNTIPANLTFVSPDREELARVIAALTEAKRP